jgi:hypothetical protein
MRPPQIHAVSFGPRDGGWSQDGGKRYARLTRVLAYTAQQHCPGWDVQIRHELTPPPDMHSAAGNQSHVWNTQKLDAWQRAMDHAQDGDRLLLMDADMMVLRPLDTIWDQTFDVAYTTRRSSRLPFNGGVVAFRVSARTRGFMARWADANRRFLANQHEHQVWRQKYAGINQASFGYMLESNHGCGVSRLPCLEWNCEDTEWAQFDPTVTRIVHLKSSLRRAIFGLERPKSYQRTLVEIWHQLEGAAERAESVAS